jgi:hypothetical protein
MTIYLHAIALSVVSVLALLAGAACIAGLAAVLR